jgi:hypothetical protein
VKGFGLRVTPTGKMTFIVQGRVEGSDKEARITVGPFGVFTTEQARDVAREHRLSFRRSRWEDDGASAWPSYSRQVEKSYCRGNARLRLLANSSINGS